MRQLGIDPWFCGVVLLLTEDLHVSPPRLVALLFRADPILLGFRTLENKHKSILDFLDSELWITNTN